MTWAIAETDARFPYLGKMMAEAGYAVAEAGGDAPADGLIARYPFSPEAEKTLRALKPGAPLLLLAGARPPETLLNLYDVRLLLDDPVFVHENAVLTAEGALCAAMRDTPFALVDAHVMVVGYGRIGRALTERLSAGGRMAVISFHSLEDRIVKTTFASLADPCVCPRDLPVCACGRKPSVRLITKKPILPTERENEENSRSHSAKLRVAEKL